MNLAIRILLLFWVDRAPSHAHKGWRARYIYALKSPREYEEVLELDMDGKGFKPYVTNRFSRVGERSGGNNQ